MNGGPPHWFEAFTAIEAILSISTLSLLAIWESVCPYFPFFRRQLQRRGLHALRNLLLGAVNALIVSLFFSGLWLAAASLSHQYEIGFLYRAPLGPWGTLIAAMLVMDFWTYWWHRMNHEISFFWRFHKVHHSDQQMDVTTAYRFHLGEITFSSLFRIAILFVVGIQLWQLVAYEVVMFACVQFHHANVGLPPWIDRLLRVIVVTPIMHKVHHSRVPSDLNSNYTSLLSIWDRLFRTFRMRSDPDRIRFGVDGLDQERWQTLPGLWRTPLASRNEN